MPTSENSFWANFVERLFHLSQANAGKRKAGPLLEGEMRSARLDSVTDCNTEEALSAYLK